MGVAATSVVEIYRRITLKRRTSITYRLRYTTVYFYNGRHATDVVSMLVRPQPMNDVREKCLSYAKVS